MFANKKNIVIELLSQVLRMLERLDAAVVVREPGNARSAEAFDGLRKQIIQSGRNQRSHIAHLLSIADSIDRGADIDLIKNRVSDFLFELGVEKTTDTSIEGAFEIIGGAGEGSRCVEPAVIQKLDNGLVISIRVGKAERMAVEVLATDESSVTPLVSSDLPLSDELPLEPGELSARPERSTSFFGWLRRLRRGLVLDTNKRISSSTEPNGSLVNEMEVE